MITVHDTAALREVIAASKNQHLRIGFVPTMGNLHAGHLSLVETAKQAADLVVCSIFVNPMQFGQGEDYNSYPRTLDADKLRLEAAGTDFLFAPSVEEIYPKPQSHQTQVIVPFVSDILCGASRPGHYTGVATIVTKLFNMVRPGLAVFGQKDYQQLHIIRQMVEDLAMPIEVIACPTVREADGLAMSSRNGYLTAAERKVAPRLYQSLLTAADSIRKGVALKTVKQVACAQLAAAGFQCDYFEIRDAFTLLEPDASARELVLLVAAYLGKPRLIDNLRVSL